MKPATFYFSEASLQKIISKSINEFKQFCVDDGMPTQIWIHNGLPKNDYGQTVTIMYDENQPLKNHFKLRFDIIDAIQDYTSREFPMPHFNPFTHHIEVMSIKINIGDFNQEPNKHTITISEFKYGIFPGGFDIQFSF